MSYLSAASADSATKKETVFFFKTEGCVQKRQKKMEKEVWARLVMEENLLD